MILFSSKLLEEPVNKKIEARPDNAGLHTWPSNMAFHLLVSSKSGFDLEYVNLFLCLVSSQRLAIHWSIFRSSKRAQSSDHSLVSEGCEAIFPALVCNKFSRNTLKFHFTNSHEKKNQSLKGSPWTISTWTRLALGVGEDNSMSNRFTLGSTSQWPPCTGLESLPIARSLRAQLPLSYTYLQEATLAWDVPQVRGSSLENLLHIVLIRRVEDLNSDNVLYVLCGFLSSPLIHYRRVVHSAIRPGQGHTWHLSNFRPTICRQTS